jgi:hypothetical protein
VSGREQPPRFPWERALLASGVTGTRFVVLLVLATFARTDGTVRVGAEQLAAGTRLNERTVREHLKGARADGWVELVERGHHAWGGGKGRVSTYRLTIPQPARRDPVEEAAPETAQPGPRDPVEDDADDPLNRVPDAPQPGPDAPQPGPWGPAVHSSGVHSSGVHWSPPSAPRPGGTSGRPPRADARGDDPWTDDPPPDDPWGRDDERPAAIVDVEIIDADEWVGEVIDADAEAPAAVFDPAALFGPREHATAGDGPALVAAERAPRSPETAAEPPAGADTRRALIEAFTAEQAARRAARPRHPEPARRRR